MGLKEELCSSLNQYTVEEFSVVYHNLIFMINCDKDCLITELWKGDILTLDIVFGEFTDKIAVRDIPYVLRWMDEARQTLDFDEGIIPKVTLPKKMISAICSKTWLSDKLEAHFFQVFDTWKMNHPRKALTLHVTAFEFAALERMYVNGKEDC